MVCRHDDLLQDVFGLQGTSLSRGGRKKTLAEDLWATHRRNDQAKSVSIGNRFLFCLIQLLRRPTHVTVRFATASSPEILSTLWEITAINRLFDHLTPN